MARLVGYKCKDCGHVDEELYNDTEERLEVLERKCPKCEGQLVMDDVKRNCHRWKFCDLGGV